MFDEKMSFLVYGGIHTYLLALWVYVPEDLGMGSIRDRNIWA